MVSKRRIIDYSDPAELPVQVTVRMPFWQRDQLVAEAKLAGVSLPYLILDAVERVYVPVPPSKV